MCRKKSVVYFAHDPAHWLLPVNGDGDGDEEAEGEGEGEGGKFTCDGCLVAGAGVRYRCSHPGCGFTIHESCARGFPRKLKSAVHPRHKLRRRVGAAADGVHGVCEVCGEDVKGACYGCAACGVAVHPLCARMPGTARGAAHAGGGHEAWLVRKAAAASSSSAPAPPGDDCDNKKEAAAASCAACGRPVVCLWRYRCVTCGEELHPRCLVPAVEQCRGAGAWEEEESMARSCCCGLLHDVTRCMATLGTAQHYRGYYNG